MIGVVSASSRAASTDPDPHRRPASRVLASRRSSEARISSASVPWWSRLLPEPVADLGRVLTVLARVRTASQSLVDEVLPDMSGLGTKLGEPVDDIYRQVKAVEVVEHDHVERGRCGALFLVSAYVHVLMAASPVGEAVDKPWVTVEGEYDRLVRREQCIEFRVRDAVRMLGGRRQAHEVDHVDHADPQLREILV